jgi:DNA/RNA endonuclease G (NUC1)
MTAVATPTDRAAEPFAGLAALQAEHVRLVGQIKPETTLDHAAAVATFVAQAVATGQRLEDRDERQAAQSLINYWVSLVSRETRMAETKAGEAKANYKPVPPVFPPDFDTLLAEYDPATQADIPAAAAGADRVLAGLEDDRLRTLARRLFLRLVRLQPDAHADARPTSAEPGPAERHFELVPATRGALYDLGPSEDVDRLVREFAAAGVLRVAKGDRPAADQIALRSARLMAEWGALREWLEQRLAMRRRAAEYVANRALPVGESWGKRVRQSVIRALAAFSVWVGRQVGRLIARAGVGLLGRDELDEVQAYHDRSPEERQLLADSRTWEQKTHDAHRLLVGFAALATGVALVMALLSARSAFWAMQEADKTQMAKHEETVARELAEERRKEAEAERDEAKRLLGQKVDAERLYESLADREIKFSAQARELFTDPEVAKLLVQKNIPNPFKAEAPAPRDWLWGTTGYDVNFLSRPVPPPVVTARYSGRPQDHNSGLVHYLHYSLVFDRARRMAVYTAANFDRTRRALLPRTPDSFVPDSRLPLDAQLTDAVFAMNSFDRGHLVGRQDIAWGPLPKAADGRPNEAAFDQAANVWPNVTPQYDTFNRGLWSAIEQWSRVEHNPAAERVTIFTGPVFRTDDYLYRGVRVPRSFWKVVVSDAGGKAGGLVVEAVLADQYDPNRKEEPIPGLGTSGRFRFAAFRVSVAQIEQLTGLDFGPALRGPADR